MCAEKHPGGNPGCLARLNLPGADPELGFGEYEPSAPTFYLPRARWRRHVVPQGPVAIATNREASVVARRERKCNGDCPSTPDRRQYLAIRRFTETTSGALSASSAGSHRRLEYFTSGAIHLGG